MQEKKRDKVAVVILNWNGERMLRQFLPTVCRCSGSDGVSVVVADNASTDASCEVVSREFPQVRLIRLDRNYGFAEGYNRALTQVEADYFVLLNSDVEVTDGWLQPLLDYMEVHPEVAACQPKLLSWREKQRFEYAGAAGGFIDALGYPYCRGRIFGTVEADEGQYDDVRLVFWATGAALFVRSADYRNVGGLDAHFFAHMEEIDFCWRLHLIGRKVACVPSSKVYHVGGATLKRENPRKTYLNFRNNLFMLYKNLPQGRLWLVLLLRFFLDYLAAAVFLLKGDFANAKSVCQARWDFWRMSAYRHEARRWVWRQLVPFVSTSGHVTGYASTASPTSPTERRIPIPEIRPKSILWTYHLRGKKTYRQLQREADGC